MAGDLYNQGQPGYYPGSTVTPFGADTQNAMSMTRGLAMGPGAQMGSNVLDNFGRTVSGGNLRGEVGLQGLNRTASGDYLHGGSGFNAAMDAAQRDIMPRVQSAFGRAGRHNSGLAQAAVAEELGDAFAGLYGDERGRQMQASGALSGLYGDERNRQMQALSMGPQMEQLAYQPAARLAQVGGTLEGKRAEEIADDQSRYNYGAQGPNRQFDAYLQRLQGIAPGSTQTQTNPLYSNPAAGAVGGAMTGLGLAQGLGSMPFFGAGGAGAAMAPWLGPAGLGLGLIGGLL